MAEKLEDLNLPQASVLKIIKEAIPDHVNIGRDVKAALAKAASMFILYITSQGTQAAQSANRKTLLPQDIFDALEEAEFTHFIKPLKDSLKDFNEGKVKKSSKPKKDEKDEPEDEEMEEDDETEEGDKDEI